MYIDKYRYLHMYVIYYIDCGNMIFSNTVSHENNMKMWCIYA